MGEAEQGLSTLLGVFGQSYLSDQQFCAVTTILGIITAVNEHIIDTAPTRNNTGSTEKYSFPYPLCLSALKDLEMLVEVVLQHYYGNDKKWNFLAITEGIKQRLESTEKVLEPLPIIEFLAGVINTFASLLLSYFYLCILPSSHFGRLIYVHFAAKIVELIIGAQTRYTYMSAS
ncbi:hypothetical protein TanjilG_14776 [Lupinus angustifolius]|uniref:Peroxisomal membrane protein PEX16 n=1 Tax=Lupinus angustifolius TaxID=3871 RepID=A0A1J7HK09_LUPAN|nr:hypothetical protein TanjilG_14776 [Lupinus angustifolius]